MPSALPASIELDAPHGAAPDGVVAPATDYGLGRVGADLSEWAETAQQTDQLRARQQAEKDDVAAKKILQGVQAKTDPAFFQAAAAYDGHDPGWAKAQIDGLNQALAPIAETSKLPVGIAAALRKNVDAYKAGFGARAIDHQGTKQGTIVADNVRANDGQLLSSAINGFNGDFAPKYQARIDGYDGTQADIVGPTMADFDDAQTKALAAAPQDVRADLQSRLSAKRVEVYAQALEAQGKGHDAYLLNATKTQVNTLINHVVSNPSLYDSVGGDIDAVLQHLPAGLRVPVRKEAMAQAAEGRVRGLIDGGNYVQAKAELDDGRYDALIAPKQKDELQKLADETKRRFSVDDWVGVEDMRGRMQSNIESLAGTGVAVQGAPQTGEIASKLGPESAAKYQDAVRQANAMHAATAGFPGMTPEQISARLASVAPPPGDPDYAAKSKAYEAAQKIAGAELEQRQKDPAGWAIGASPQVSAAYQAYSNATNPQDGALAGARYAVMSLNAQEAAGIPAAARRILPSGWAKQLVQGAESTDPQTREQQLTTLAGFVRGFAAPPGTSADVAAGSQARVRMVGRELIAAGLKPADYAAVIDLGDDPVGMSRYVQAATSEALVKIRDRPTKETERLNTAVRADLGPHLDTLRPSQGNVELEGGRVEMVKTMAMGLMAQGQSPEDAAKAAASVLTSKYYYDPGGWRLPKDAADQQGRQAIDFRSPLTIARTGASLTLQDLSAHDHAGFAAGIDNPALTPSANRALYADKITHNGRWVTSADDKGLMLMYPRGDGTWAPALGGDGNPIARDWPTLFRKAWGRGPEPQTPAVFDRLAWSIEHLGEHGHNGDVGPMTPSGQARGVMQVMPGTAREIDPNVDVDRLQNDPAYNRQFGRTRLRQMLDRYSWMPELGVAAYNAGPGAVDGWIKRYGDPRKGDLTPSQWAGQIPFDETRRYVARVLGR